MVSGESLVLESLLIKGYVELISSYDVAGIPIKTIKGYIGNCHYQVKQGQGAACHLRESYEKSFISCPVGNAI